jgi:hypothetical protein
MQSVTASLPPGELVFDGQLEHAVPPLAAKYVPLPHARHAVEPLTSL